MERNKEVILNSPEIVRGVQEAYEAGGIEECQRRGFEVHEIRPAHPNEIVLFEHFPKPEPYQEAKEWLDAMCLICLPLWMEQLRTFGIKDSVYWQMCAKEREAKRNARTRTLND